MLAATGSLLLRSLGWSVFWLYGLPLDGVVNQAWHTRDVRVRAMKYPPRYGIDLLIDDSHGVRIEGERHGFRTLVVDPTGPEWTEKVKAHILLLAENAA